MFSRDVLYYWVCTWFVLASKETCHKVINSPFLLSRCRLVLPLLDPLDQVEHSLVPLTGHLLLPHHPPRFRLVSLHLLLFLLLLLLPLLLNCAN